MASPTRRRTSLVAVIVGLALPASALSSPAQAAPADPGKPTKPQIAAAVTSKVAPEVRRELADDNKTTFWVRLNKQADLSVAHTKTTKNEKAAAVYRSKTEFARTSQAGLRDLLDHLQVDYKPFWVTNTIQVTGNTKVLGEIAVRPEVARIEPNETIPAPKPVATGLKPLAKVDGIEWNIDRINAPRVWDELGVRGDNVVVANIDTGVEWNHPALIKSYRGTSTEGADHNYNWFDPAGNCSTPAPCDGHGHGSHTMGTMVGDDGTNQIGVAPGAKWIAASVCDASGSCDEASLLAAGQWIIAPTDLAGNNPRPDLAPDVVNNSWGRVGQDQWYADTVAAWVAAGIFPSFSNGNSGPGCSTTGSPGSYSKSYSSGAFDINNAIAGFSSRGVGEGGEIKPNIAAPGVNVRSSIPGGFFSSFSGTSMAAPHTSGVAALLLSASPALTGNIDEIRRLLDTTAIDVNDTSCGGTIADNLTWGEGRLDAYAAVSNAPRGAVGELQGTITSGGTPVAGATVTADGSLDRTTTSAADGTYTFPNLAVGEYAVKATKFGYAAANGTATITEDATATVDLALERAPSATLSGTVSTGSGPAADATVEVSGTPLSARTDAQGRYSITAPTGEYDLQVSHASRCADRATRHVVLSGDTTLDITLPDRVDAYGYACGLTGGTYPEVSTKFDLTGDDTTKPIDLPFAVPFYGNVYRAATISTNGILSFGTASTSGSNSSIPSTGTPNGSLYPFWDDLRVDAPDAAIYTGVVGKAPHRSFVVEWRNVNFYTDATARLSIAALISEDGSIVYRYKDVSGTGLEAGSGATIGLENTTGTVGFQYSLDSAVVSDGLALAFRTTKSGVVRGRVLDANDNAAVVGATVTAKTGDTVVGTSTTGPDGSYLLPAAIGEVTVKAEATNYQAKTGTTTITPGGVTVFDSSLPTAKVTSTPSPLVVVVPAGQSRKRSVTLANVGGVGTSFSVAESDGEDPTDVPWLSVTGDSGTLAPGGKATVNVSVTAAGLTAGTYQNAELRVTSTSGRTPVLKVPVVLVVPGFQVALDSGSTRAHVDALGDSWSPDKLYTAGGCGYQGFSWPLSTTKTIAATDDQVRLSTARENAYEYRCDGLADGVYTVELDFAELRNARANTRVFDVLVEDVEVLPSLDIALAVGSYTATSRTYTVHVVDGQLNVRFVTHFGFGMPTVNALRVTHRPDKS